MEDWPKRLAPRQLSCCTHAAYAAKTPTAEIASNVTEPIVAVRVAASAKSRNAKQKTSKLSMAIMPARSRRTLRDTLATDFAAAVCVV